MKLGAVENKARLAMALFVLALLLTIGLSLALYSQARAELTNERMKQLRLEAALLVSDLPDSPGTLTDGSLKELLQRSRISAAATLFDAAGRPIASAATLERASQPELRPLTFHLAREGQVPGVSGPAEVRIRSESNYDVAEAAGPRSTVLVMARPSDSASSPVIFYVFSYQIVALILVLGLLFLLARWLLRPYRRMVEAARGSPVHIASARTESEFVVHTFQALIEQLQSKERELAQLHAAERKRAERSERFSERLIANIPSGLVAVNSQAFVTSANTQAREIFGAAGPTTEPLLRGAIEHDLERLTIDYKSFFRSAPKLVEMISECLAQGATFRRAEADVTYSDGRVRHLGLSVSPITDASSRVEGALCMMTDLTEVIELRERMKLQDNLANLGEMAAGLAHEFKNSLATIHGFVQLLDAQVDVSGRGGDQHRTLEATLNEVRLLTRLVTDFLNFARPQKLSLLSVDLRAIIEDCVEELRAPLENAEIELRIEGTFPELAGDESMLRRAFVNLLRNAAEAINEQSTVRLIRVIGSVDKGQGLRYAHVRIRDTGGGISAEDLHRIFIPFFTTKSRGYGIGLAIVQKILVAHGGNVSVERSDSSGTVLHCRLPLSDHAEGVK